MKQLKVLLLPPPPDGMLVHPIQRGVNFLLFACLWYFHFIVLILTFLFLGKVVYSGVTFAGQVGLLTAQRPNAVTVSLDARGGGTVWQNIFQVIFNRKAPPITFVI